MFNLKGKVVLVTGATRGIGKGIAISLARKGAIIYFTGRTEKEYQGAVKLGGSIEATEQAIKQVGGIGYGIKCDHKDDIQTKMVIDKIVLEQGRIDILVNNVWGGYEYFNDGTEFWNEKGFWTAPISRFDKMFESGVRAHYVTTCYTVPSMIKQKSGLIVNISYWAAERNDMGVAYGMAKAATNKMTETMAHELREHNISVVTVYPGLVRTESVIKSAEFFDLSNSESTEFIGLAIAALATDLNVLEKSGTKQIAAQVALDYGYKDIDGKQPIPLNKSNCQ
ncbi:SDR family NAD(P)-dependent oxidoreductase [Clostridium lundense]|uniref:SDR family NAD(P)-dependent oxidoreductase n=1 Tax=Clostridium lundense TaxID=319475 RepID=UPI0004838BB9|nr:SDR family NAD(P)-dependent oxidoreductase [Clostridium lundense]